VARRVGRGELWLLRFAPPDKRRPVLILTRPSLLMVLHTATVAAVTTVLRGSPTEVELGVEDGLKTTSCVNLTNVFTVKQADLRQFIGTVSSEKMTRICRALAIATGCDSG
jgi:mRNA interferase MazF